MTLENNISCLCFHLRREEAKQARRWWSGWVVVDFYQNLVPALNIVWKFYILLALSVRLQSSRLP